MEYQRGSVFFVRLPLLGEVLWTHSGGLAVLDGTRSEGAAGRVTTPRGSPPQLVERASEDSDGPALVSGRPVFDREARLLTAAFSTRFSLDLWAYLLELRY
jgi:hypothetical protein